MKNRKLILLLILVLISSIITGCQNKAPEGVGQDFYDDMLECLTKLEKYKGDEDNNGIGVIENYMENKIWLSTKEQEIIEAVDDMYFWVWLYHNDKDTNRMIVRDSIKNATYLLGIDINIDKLIPQETK